MQENEKNIQDIYREDEIDLGKLFFVLWRKKWFIGGFTFVITAIMIALLLFASLGEENLYNSSGRIKIYTDEYEDMLTNSFASNSFKEEIKDRFLGFPIEQIFYTISDDVSEDEKNKERVKRTLREMIIWVVDSSATRSKEIADFALFTLNKIINDIYSYEIAKNNENTILIKQSVDEYEKTLSLVSDAVAATYARLERESSPEALYALKSQIGELTNRESSLKSYILSNKLKNFFDYSKMKVIDKPVEPEYSLEELSTMKKIAEELRGFDLKKTNKRLVVVITFLTSFIAAAFFVLITNFIKENRKRFSE